MYGPPAWWGYTQARGRERIETFVNRLKRNGFLPSSVQSAEKLEREADTALFRAIVSNPLHVLRRFFPELRQNKYNLRLRSHEFVLPPKDDRNFIPRLLYRDMF